MPGHPAPSPGGRAALKDDENLQVIEKPGFNLGYIAYNVRHKPSTSLEVRQALDMAVNKQSILNAVYQGAGQLAVNAMPPTQWSYDETIKDAAYNPEKGHANCSRPPGSRKAPKSPCGRCPCNAPTTPTPS